jgi:hypothetical protein
MRASDPPPAVTATRVPVTTTNEVTATPSATLAASATGAATATMMVEVEAAAGKLSELGVLRVWYTSTVEPPPVNELHTWILHVETAEGDPVEGAVITVAGDMPAHGHGLPTQPRVTDYLGNGDYLVEGMKFSMGGEWVMTFEIEASGGVDRVHFDLTLDE